MNDGQLLLRDVTRRYFFRDCGVGLGKVALATLLARSTARAAGAEGVPNPLAPGNEASSLLPSGIE